MEQVLLKPLLHKGQQCIAIYFKNCQSLNALIRKYLGAKWSNTVKVWYVVNSNENYLKIKETLINKACIDDSALLNLLENKKRHITQPINNSAIAKAENTEQIKIPVLQPARIKVKGETIIRLQQIHYVNEHVIPLMEQMLKLKGYSPSTIKTYRGEMSQLLLLLRATPADDLSTAKLKRYLLYCYEKLQLSENTLHSRMNALKFYYEQVLGKEKFFWEIPRPKKQQQNPNFFNQDEITRIIKQTANVKHKTMLMLAYSTGMRVSEVTSLKVWQIDSKRMQIIVKQAKGKKDRITTLSPVLLVMLREYFIAYKPKKDGFLFYGQHINEPYSTRSLQLVLQAAKQRAGILKPGSVHALRHSFATHLLDKGTDVTMIMKLLGHNDIKTTLRYLHVTNRDVLQIISPLDQLNLE